MRAQIQLRRLATSKNLIKYQWMRYDPDLKRLSILRLAYQTTFKVSFDAAARLSAIWLKTGVDWTYAESVAGLWAYGQTYGGPVSELPGSPVAQVALQIGRAVSGVYNKVMNFRALDPRDERKGMSGAGATDRALWADFLQEPASALNLELLDNEYRRLWPSFQPSANEAPGAVVAEEIAFEEEVTRRAKVLSEAELEVRIASAQAKNP